MAAVCLGLSLTAWAKKPVNADELALVTRIREKILAQTKAPEGNYEQRIPGTTVSYAMVQIPAGTFLLGSPDSEPGRSADEGPQVKVELPSFWIGKHEVTWDLYEVFMFARDQEPEADSAAVSHPTKPYVDMTFGMGREGFPAVNVTHHAANKFCQWLSAKTGHFYRLPTEAEWEYAARAGTQTAYYFGNDIKDLPRYAHFEGEQYAKIGSKEPNAWGLYDVLGNASEWTLDQYEADAYSKYGGKGYVHSQAPYPHVVRGGSWNDEASKLRIAARVASSPEWKMLDPQLPKSVWYHTSVPWVGFRIVRVTEIPSAEEMARYWNNGVERDEG